MPTHTVTIPPGVSGEFTPSLNQGAWQSSNQIRFAPSGLPQKLGGWAKFYPFSIGSITRALHAWEDTSSVLHLGVGATASLGVITNSIYHDITPQVATDNPAVNFSTTSSSNVVTIVDSGSQATVYDVVVINTPVSVGGLILLGAYAVTQQLSSNSFTINAASNATATVANGGAVPQYATTSGSSFVTVTLANHGYSVGSTFPATVSTTVGGVTISGFYTVQSVVNANTFTIGVSNQASNTATASMNGGNAQLIFYITIAPLPPASGFGDGGFGLGGFGTGQAPSGRTGTPITVTDYTLDNWGAYLMACPNDGPIFVWQPDSGLVNAQMIAQAPIANTGIFVSMPAQILVAYGSSVLDIQDPLLINWSDAGQYTVWTPLTTNQAGSYRIPRGSAIIGGMQGPQYALIWTDLSVWSMSYIGQPFVFSFNELASGCGLIGKFAAVTLGTTVYWMSQKNFFCLPSGGSVAPVPCSVWDFVFQNLDRSNVAKIRAAANSQFGEVTWYFPVAGGSGENTAYVKFTPALSCWDYGFNSSVNVGRSAWIDQSVFGSPIGADPVSELIYQHEVSNDADGQPMTPVVTSGYWALSDGEDMMTNDAVYPDFKFAMVGAAGSASVNVVFNYADYAQSTVYQSVSYTMQSGNPSFLRPMVRGRLMSMSISSSDLGTWWRLGGLRIRTAPDGRL